jgi:tetratricopeptide (TPR) repeat protein
MPPALALLLALVTADARALERLSILSSLSLDDTGIGMGADSLAVYQNARGEVRPSELFRMTGYRAVELRDRAGDKEAPEARASFARRDDGQLHAHFAFLTAMPGETFHAALVGPRGFELGHDGAGFWLQAKGGVLFHVTGREQRRLITLRPFTWYGVGVRYDVDEGLYDLTIVEEGRPSPAIVLARQRNASGERGSAIDRLAFSGDRADDATRPHFFVDDALVGTDESISRMALPSPGRRRLFVDAWSELRQKLGQRPRCLPVHELGDLGFDRPDLPGMKKDGSLAALRKILAGAPVKGEEETSAMTKSAAASLLRAAAAWSDGCRALDEGEAERALKLFRKAARETPDAVFYELHSVLALAAAKRWEEMDFQLGVIHPLWLEDDRFGAALAMIGAARKDLGAATGWLERPPEQTRKELEDALVARLWAGEVDQGLIAKLKKRNPSRWRPIFERALVAEQYYHVLLWLGRFGEAEGFASRVAARLSEGKVNNARWLVFAGDASFHLGSFERAAQWYDRAIEGAARFRGLVYARLADANFKLGKVERERLYREKLYEAAERGGR